VPFVLHAILRYDTTLHCSCLQGLLRPENLPAKSDQALFEMGFVFAAVWAFGGALAEKDGIKYRQKFSEMWKVRGGWRVVATSMC